jgi:hypothetical protein
MLRSGKKRLKERELITYKRICIRDWKIEFEDGKSFQLERGKEYITSDTDDHGYITVFASFWVVVPANLFAGELKFT